MRYQGGPLNSGDKGQNLSAKESRPGRGTIGPNGNYVAVPFPAVRHITYWLDRPQPAPGWGHFFARRCAAQGRLDDFAKSRASTGCFSSPTLGTLPPDELGDWFGTNAEHSALERSGALAA
jgi:hypothetical protein